MSLSFALGKVHTLAVAAFVIAGGEACSVKPPFFAVAVVTHPTMDLLALAIVASLAIGARMLVMLSQLVMVMVAADLLAVAYVIIALVGNSAHQCAVVWVPVLIKCALATERAIMVRIARPHAILTVVVLGMGRVRVMKTGPALNVSCPVARVLIAIAMATVLATHLINNARAETGWVAIAASPSVVDIRITVMVGVLAPMQLIPPFALTVLQAGSVWIAIRYACMEW